MGAWLTRTTGMPEHLVSSTATRAHQTMVLAKEAGSWDIEIQMTDRLYEATFRDYMDVVRETPDHADSVLVAGHEPTCSTTTAQLIGGGFLRFPTAAMARIDVAVASWGDIERGSGSLIWFMPPKFL